MDNIGGQLKTIMRSRNLSIKDLEMKTGVHEDILLAIESNTFDGNVSTLIKISESLNMTFYIGCTAI